MADSSSQALRAKILEQASKIEELQKLNATLTEENRVLKRGASDGRNSANAASFITGGEGNCSADLSIKIEDFFHKQRTMEFEQCKESYQLQVVNFLVTHYHKCFSDVKPRLRFSSPSSSSTASLSGSSSNTSTSSSNRAQSIAFSSALTFFQQVSRRAQARAASKNSFELVEAYPTKWLLNVFPFMPSPSDGRPSDTFWMPLHLALAIDLPQDNMSSKRQFMSDLNILLVEYGDSAFDEEVSPLCIAVGKENPSIEVVQTVVNFQPESVNTTDADGSLPLMHACAVNQTLDVIQYLHTCYPAAIAMRDNYDCAAIHYACFSGCAEVVSFLLEAHPACVKFAEGNGALPLHDAVQNERSNATGDISLVSTLLVAYPAGTTTEHTC